MGRTAGLAFRGCAGGREKAKALMKGRGFLLDPIGEKPVSPLTGN